MKVGVNDFARRHIKGSRFSYYNGTLEDVAALAAQHFYVPCMHQGYRDGVLEIDVPPEGFFSGVVQLHEGDKLTGAYQVRRAGETPRKHVGIAGGIKMPAKAVTLILYRHDVLVADGDASTDAEWELISINARTTEGPEPINPEVLMANHFGVPGGTPTNMTDAEFVKALKVAYEYWQDKTMVEL